MSAPPVVLPIVAVEQLLRAVDAVAVEHERLTRQRATSMAALAEHWIGGHRCRYDTALQAVERDARRLLDLLVLVTARYRRELDAAHDRVVRVEGAATSSAPVADTSTS